VKVDYISLVNLIVNEPLVKELIQDDLTTDKIVKELQLLLDDKSRKKEIFLGYHKLRKILTDQNASENTAEEIYNILSVKRNEFT
jgi:lipid-A-disaccharide synthase